MSDFKAINFSGERHRPFEGDSVVPLSPVDADVEQLVDEDLEWESYLRKMRSTCSGAKNRDEVQP